MTHDKINIFGLKSYETVKQTVLLILADGTTDYFIFVWLHPLCEQGILLAIKSYTEEGPVT